MACRHTFGSLFLVGTTCVHIFPFCRDCNHVKFFGFELHWSHPGTQILAVFICLIALVCGGFVAMLQNRVLRARSSKLSYIVLGFLALITLLFVPTPFNFVIN